MKNNKLNLKIGDVFTIPINNNEIVYGQIVLIEGTFIKIIVFDKKNSINNKEYNVSSVVNEKVIIFTKTFTNYLKNSTWKKHGNYALSNNFKWPLFKVGDYDFGDAMLVNHKGNNIRKLSKEEFDKLFYRGTCSEKFIISAILIYYKYEKDDIDYHGILYENLYNSFKDIKVKPKSFFQKLKDKININMNNISEVENPNKYKYYFTINIQNNMEIDLKSNLFFRQKIEKKLDNILQKEKLGFVDGGEISDNDMNIFGFVSEKEKAYTTISELFKKETDEKFHINIELKNMK